MTAFDPNSPLAPLGLATRYPWAPPSPLQEGAPVRSTAPRQPPSARGAPASSTSRPAGRPLRCARTQRLFSLSHPCASARRRRAGLWRASRTPSIAGPEAARASALRRLTRGRCSTTANAVSGGSLAAGLGTEKRRGAGAQRRPSELSATGLPAVALPPRRWRAASNARTASNVRSGSIAVTQEVAPAQVASALSPTGSHPRHAPSAAAHPALRCPGGSRRQPSGRRHSASRPCPRRAACRW